MKLSRFTKQYDRGIVSVFILLIELLADAPLCASDIAQRLQAPLTTITYNLENLESVGLIKVEKIKYSEKGREVKIYTPVIKLIVLVPEKTDRKSVADILRKYLGIILTALFASSLIEFFMRNLANTITAHPGLVFFMGCLFVVALLIIMDYRRNRNG